MQPSVVRPGTRRRWMVLFGLCAVLLLPLLVVDVPPLTDYPNHLARIFVLASLPSDPVLAEFFAPHWSIIPNLALDLVGPPLIHVLPVHVVGRLLIAASVLLPVLGTVAYRAALDARLGGHWWSFGVGLVGYNSLLLHGFLNFTLSLGLALLLAAGWLRWREDRPLLAIGLAMAGAPLLFVCHLMGLVFFAVLIGAAELFRVLLGPRRGWLKAAIGRGVVLLLVLLIPGMLYAVSALQSLGGDAGFVGPVSKLVQFVGVFANYTTALDFSVAVVAVGLPCVGLFKRWGVIPGPAAIAILLLLGLYLAAPSAWKGTYSLDTRFAVMLAFMLFAGFVPDRWPVRLRIGTVSLLGSLFLLRLAVLTTAWAAHNTDLADLRFVLEPVRPGQAVYVAQAAVAEAPAYWTGNPGWRLLSDGARTDDHLGALLLIEHRAYWPFEFDVPSQQPIVTQPRYRALATRIGHMPDRTEAALADVCGFDDVLVLDADSVPDLPAERFRLLRRSGFAALYGIIRCEGMP